MKTLKWMMLALALVAAPVAATRHETDAQPASGEVRKVDRDARKITIRHGPITSLDMPAMTMVFQVRDAELLERVKSGDKIRFTAEKSGGQYVVIHIEPEQ